MSDQTHNGWTNYATWRVNLEVFDGIELREWFDRDQYPTLDLYEVAEWAKSHAETMIEYEVTRQDIAPGTIVAGWASAFLADVDWQMIARHLIETRPSFDRNCES